MPAPSPFAALVAATALIASPLVPLTAGVASAPVAVAEAGGTFLPFSPTLRRCDYSTRQYYDSAGIARATATVRGGDSGQVSADVQVVVGKPNAAYEVRLIQVPRASAAGCGPGAPGTAAGTLHTDGVGAGALRLSSPVMAGATGAWLAIERPQPNSQLPGEFYTTDFIVGI